MNLKELRKSTRKIINEETDVFFSDDDIDFAINESYFELADATEFYEREAQIPMLKWRTYYDLSKILAPDTFLSPRRCQNVTTSKWLDPTDTREMDYHTYVQWEKTLGEPEKYFMRGNWWFGVFPKPTQDGIGIRFYHTAIPPRMVNDSDIPLDIPREFHVGLIDGAMADLMGQQRETQKAIQYWNSFQTTVNKVAAFVDGRTSIAEYKVL